MTQRSSTSLSDGRRRALEATRAGFDAVIVGAGVNGLGMAWDAALRGLRVLVVEKGDIGSGTSSWSSKMIHGGLKYLEQYDVPLVRESLHEREWLLRAAPHLVRELRFIIPFYGRNTHSKNMLRVGMLAYDVLSFDKSLQHFQLHGRDAALRRAPGLDPAGLEGAAVFSDGQAVYPERISVEIALAAEAAGAVILTHARATELGMTGDRVTSITIHDELDGGDHTVPTSVVINAAGPWIDQVFDNVDLPRMNGGTKGTHLVVDPFPGAPAEAFYYEAVTDSRPLLVIPWKGRYLLGSTDIRFEGDLDTVSAGQDEYDYIIDETNKVLPGAGLTMADVKYAYTGVRPLPYKADGATGDITRRHELRSHAAEGRDGLFTLIGGKLTTFRQVGEEVGDLLSKRFGRRRKSVTRKLPLPGGGQPDLAALRAEVVHVGIDERLARRLVDQYGTRAVPLAALITSSQANSQVLDEAFGLTRGEVVWAVTNENAHRLSDVVARRVMTGVEDDLGLGSLDAVAAVCAELLGWDEARTASEIERHHSYITRFQPPGRN
ncbi:glycerol-3-phosphate dehydrogenase/oxidase [Micropruina sonneratiae]|uniref:glycerol-3-phosphate dehydrogenase/oxidase n=1 Tax=Micropruina sonneratiae TaxID=2986940 RepID=UPI0022264B3D|nr:glycerol-3-phosphate dehydrogenase/oxidase [Micropruina sp. KQZ13P-5]MCW3159496.1 glycerol-3-phosphate dehydrogenase/oxidase [Micropruina sp. KQZ13P-5]